MITITKKQLIWLALSIVILLLGALLSMCNSEPTGTPLKSNPMEDHQVLNETKDATERWKKAERWYSQSCSLCHGENREGRLRNPALSEVHKKYTTQTLYEIIINGKGDMAGGFLQGIEARIVAEWLVEVLSLE